MFSGEAAAYIPRRPRCEGAGPEGNTGWRRSRKASNASRNFSLAVVPGSVPGFLDAQVAYRLRTEGPPDEWHGDLTVGFKFTPKIMLMLQDFTTVLKSTNDPTFPAGRQSTVEASVVYALSHTWSIQAGLFSTVWTVRTNSEHGAVLAVCGGIFEGVETGTPDHALSQFSFRVISKEVVWPHVE